MPNSNAAYKSSVPNVLSFSTSRELHNQLMSAADDLKELSLEDVTPEMLALTKSCLERLGFLVQQLGIPLRAT